MVESVAEASFMQSAAEASMVESVVEHEASIVDEASASAGTPHGTPHHSGRSPRDSGVILSDASFASSEAASVASEVSSEVARSMRT